MQHAVTMLAKRNDIKPVLWKIRPVMIMIGAIPTNTTGKRCRFRHTSRFYSPTNLVFGFSLFWISGFVLALNLSLYFWMFLDVSLVTGFYILLLHLISIVVILPKAFLAPGMMTVFVAWTLVEIVKRLGGSTLRTRLGFHRVYSKSNAPYAIPVQLPRPHVRHKRRRYQYSTRVCGLGNFNYSTPVQSEQ